MQNPLLTQYAHTSSQYERTSDLHLGRIDSDTYEAIALLHDLTMHTRFGYPIYDNWLDTPMLLVQHYLIVRLVMMRICPFIGVFPKSRTKWKFHSDFNRPIPIG